MTQGKCVTCKKAFRFKWPRRLRDASCPYCGNKLIAASSLLRWPWEERNVAVTVWELAEKGGKTVTNDYNTAQESELDASRRARSHRAAVGALRPPRTMADVVTVAEGPGIHQRHVRAAQRILYLGILAAGVFAAWVFVSAVKRAGWF